MASDNKRPVGELSAVTDSMIAAYLATQRAFVEDADRKFGRPNIGGLHTNTVREACRAGLTAAIAADRELRRGEAGMPVVAYGYENTRPTGERHSLMMVKLDNVSDQYPELATPLIRQSDAQAALAAQEVEIEGLRKDVLQARVELIVKDTQYKMAVNGRAEMRHLFRGARAQLAAIAKETTE